MGTVRPLVRRSGACGGTTHATLLDEDLEGVDGDSSGCDGEDTGGGPIPVE